MFNFKKIITEIWFAILLLGGIISPVMAANPVLFVHGIQPVDSDDSDGYKTWNSFKQAFQQINLISGGVWQAYSKGGSSISGARCVADCSNSTSGDFYIIQFTDGWGLTFSEQGGELKQVIDAIKAAKGLAIKFDIVAHSMGGLAARSYLQNLHRSGENYPVSGGDVGKLITIGTPHKGSPLGRICPITDDARRSTELLAVGMCVGKLAASVLDLGGSALGACSKLALIEICDKMGFAVEQLRDDSGALKILNACMTSNTSVCSIGTSTASHQLPLDVSYYSVVAIRDSRYSGYYGLYTDDIVSADSQNLSPPFGYSHYVGETVSLTGSDFPGHTSETNFPSIIRRVMRDYLGFGNFSVASRITLFSNLTFNSVNISGFISGQTGTMGSVFTRYTKTNNGASIITQSSNINFDGRDTSVDVLISGLQASTEYSIEMCVSQNLKTVCSIPVTLTTPSSGIAAVTNLPAPSIPSPANTSVVPFGSTVLRWARVNNASSYRVVLATNVTNLPSQPQDSVCTGCILNWTPEREQFRINQDSLIPGTKYFWRVKARNSDQYGEWSSIWSFTVAASSLLPKPILASPLNSAVLTSAQPTLSWSPIVNATSYRVFLATNSDALQLTPESSTCPNCVFNGVTSETSIVSLPGLLSPGSTYYWRVKARSTTQYGALSDIYRFTVSQAQCSFGFASSTLTTSAFGGTYPLTLMTQPGCSAAATSNQTYCTVSPSPVTADSSGQAGLNLTISANAAVARSCVVSVGNGTLNVSQPANAPLSTWTLTLNQSAGGTASVTPSQSTYADGTTVYLVATPASGYTFAGWQDSGTIVSAGANYAFSLRGSRTLTPVFSSTQVTATGLISPNVSADQKWRLLGDRISTNVWQSNGETISLISGVTYRVDCADTPYYQPSAYTFNFTAGSSFGCNYTAKAQLPFSPSLTLRPQPRLASGTSNSLARLDDGRTLMWGLQRYTDFPNYAMVSPQAGTPTLLRPLFLPNSDDVAGVNISAGQSLGMITVSTAGEWKRWGNPANSAVRVPTLDANLTGFIRISGNLGLKADGTLWFVNQAGSNTPVTTVSDIVDIAGSYRSYQTLALRKDGAVVSLTDDANTSNCATQGISYLPNGSYQNCTIPVAMPSLSRVVSIAVNNYDAYAVKEDGTVWVWGFDTVSGGAVRPVNDNRPIQIPGVTNAAQVVAGGQLVYVRTQSGGVYAWGANDVGQLGRGTISPTETSPQLISGLSNIVELGQTSGAGLLALDSSGFVWTEGMAGAVGNGTPVTAQSTPVKVSCPNGFTGDLNLVNFSTYCSPSATNVLTVSDRNLPGGKQVMIDGVPVVLPFTQSYLTGSKVTVEVIPDIGMGFGGFSGDLAESQSRTRTISMNRDWNLLVDTSSCAAFPSNSATVVNGSSMVPIAVASTGGSQAVDVLTDTPGSIDKCHWGFYTTDTWLRASADGFGASTFTMNVEPNPGTTERVGNFKIGGASGRDIKVTQAASAVVTAPDTFSFPAYIGAPISTLIQSGSVTISGINTASAIGIVNGEYSIGCNGAFTQSAGNIVNGQTVCVRQTSSSLPQTATVTTLTIGGVSGVFTVTTQTIVPSAPIGLTATAGNTQVSVSFNAPASDGGSAVTGYTLTSNPAGGVDANAGSTTLTHIVTGLSNGTAYTFTAVANNIAGSSLPSAASNSVSPQFSNQTISFGLAPSLKVGDTGTLTATGGASGNPVTFGTSTPTVCGVNGSTVTGLLVGSCVVTANQAGNANYNAAAQVTQTIAVTQSATTAVSFVQGWNLLGNSLDQAFSVVPALADPAIVTTVWKWDVVANGWQFYSPSLLPADLQTYATNKGYQVLSVINPGEGYWVNAKVAGSLSGLAGSSFTLGSAHLTTGWNLVATGSDVAPAAFNLSLSATPPSGGTIPNNLTSLWAWDGTLLQWYFYAPSLEASGGLGNYITGKGYLDFGQHGKTLGNGTGFWVNRP
jgi:pimeloyl-ACP methyl ester carboxylesterase